MAQFKNLKDVPFALQKSYKASLANHSGTELNKDRQVGWLLEDPRGGAGPSQPQKGTAITILRLQLTQGQRSPFCSSVSKILCWK